MGNILKIEAFAGASGDMFLGAFAGLADAYESILNLPALLHLEKEAEIRITDVIKTGIACKHVKVIEKHIHTQHNHHQHDEESNHHGKEHHHRHIGHIYELIDRAEISENAKQIAKDIFLHLGTAEARIHGIPLEQVHFHEVGAIDSIMDIVGSAWLLDQLSIDKVYSTPITTGFGFAKTEHGKLPVPAPATQLLLQGFPTKQGDQAGELTTPTGAAILKYLKPVFEIPVLREMKTSYGPGEKDLEIPNALRLSLCENGKGKDNIIVIQTNIDDLSGEYLGLDFQQKLLDQGALDFYIQQVIMKKGRPGIVLTVLTPESGLKKIGEVILENTSSIGIRYFPVDRMELDRQNIEIETEFGKVKAKKVILPSGKKRVKPESDDIFRISRETGISPLEIIRQFNNHNNQ
jgi:pyridinium-3,5-bisthiocarboxylic acid mononucleotide nickel chelatase